MKRIAVFPGSFDPFTLGHIDVLRSALPLFDKIFIAVGYNHLKKGFLEPKKRLQLIEDCIKMIDHPNTEIETCLYTGMTIDFCKKNEINTIIRGLRTTNDFDNETIIAQANRLLCPEISTVFIPASAEHSFISSTVVRDVFINKGEVKKLMPVGIDIKNYITNNK